MAESTRQSKRKATQPWKHLVQADRRAAAEARQAERDKRSPQQQLEHLDKYGFVAARERARLQKAIAEQSSKAPEKQAKKSK